MFREKERLEEAERDKLHMNKGKQSVVCQYKLNWAQQKAAITGYCPYMTLSKD